MRDPAGLELRALRVRRRDRLVLDGITLSAAPGSMTALLGPNGAGKSTLVKAAAGLLPHDGQVLIEGRDARGLSRGERARLVAYVPQHSALEAAIAARDVVAQGRFAHRGPFGRPSADDEAAIARALEATGAGPFADRRFDRLSYGERRLVLLARALATSARVLLLDEPTAALDVRHALRLLALLRATADGGRCVVVVLHQLQEAVDACDRAVLLDGGRVVASGATAEVVAAAPVRRVYGVTLVPGAQFGYRMPEP